MDFVPCPRCQEMNPPNVVKCTACGASMDEEPIEVTPLAFAPKLKSNVLSAPSIEGVTKPGLLLLTTVKASAPPFSTSAKTPLRSRKFANTASSLTVVSGSADTTTGMSLTGVTVTTNVSSTHSAPESVALTTIEATPLPFAARARSNVLSAPSITGVTKPGFVLLVIVKASAPPFSMSLKTPFRSR